MRHWFGIVLSCGLISAGAFAATPPLPRVVEAGLAVDLADIVTLPPGAANQPARVNYLFHAGDGSGRLFVADMRGRIYVIKAGKLLAQPFLDVAAARGAHFDVGSDANGETGLLTFAFHPDYAIKGAPGYGKFYTLDCEDAAEGGNQAQHYNVLSEWTADPAHPDRINPASRREILRLMAGADDHGGGQLGFDPNARPRDADYGLLYISVGDGGDDDTHPAQDMSSASGKILRINPLRAAGRSYSVPPTNPFVHDKNALPEIWASGLRNPERFSWDSGGLKKMLIADIGQATVEEINVGQAGANYGWGVYEGDFLIDHAHNLTALPNGKPPKGFTFPVAVYGHADGQAVTGGFVYRGKTIPELTGQYVFGDITSGALFYADAASLESGARSPIFKLGLVYHGAPATLAGITRNSHADLRFGLGEDGEIYLLTKADGAVRKLVRHLK